MEATRQPLLTIIVPGYNEADAIESVVQRYHAALDGTALDAFELLLINDGSKDATGAIADRLAATHPKVQVIHHAKNQGQSAALITGYRAARGAIISQNAMDLPFDPQDTLPCIQPVLDGECEVMVVERANREAYGLFRKVMSLSHALVWKLVFGSPFTDLCFVQFYRAEVLSQIEVVSKGVSTVSAEYILRAYRGGHRVRSMHRPYHRRQVGNTTITSGKIMHTVKELGRLAVQFRPQKLAGLPPLDLAGQAAHASLATHRAAAEFSQSHVAVPELTAERN